MADAFKHQLNIELIAAAASHFEQHWPAFKREAFVEHCDRQLEALELKARSQYIAKVLDQYLPIKFEAQCELISRCLTPLEYIPHTGNAAVNQQPGTDQRGICGWFVMALCEWLALKTDQKLDESFRLMAELTSRWSAEFVIRPFIRLYPKQTFHFIEQLSRSDNVHQRRLASEGSRPRLPWGERLYALVDDPSPSLPMLASLATDPADYVRKSVANHINDISKDHPQIALAFCRRLDLSDKKQLQLLRQALRGLIKQGDNEALALLGYKAVDALKTILNLSIETIDWQGQLSFTLHIEGPAEQPLLIDFIVYYQKANGSVSPKVFKWKQTTSDQRGQLTLSKTLSLKDLSTRKHHPGQHYIAAQINGVEFERRSFTLAASISSADF